MVFGIVKGAAGVAITLALCSAASHVPFIGEPINQKIAETKVTSFAYKYVDDFVETQLTKEKIDSIIDKIITDNTIPEDNGESTPETPPTSSN